MESDTVIFREEFYSTISKMPEDMQLTAYKVVFNYAFYGEIMDDIPAIVGTFFNMAKPRIDNSSKKYKEKCEQAKRERQAILERLTNNEDKCPFG